MLASRAQAGPPGEPGGWDASVLAAEPALPVAALPLPISGAGPASIPAVAPAPIREAGPAPIREAGPALGPGRWREAASRTARPGGHRSEARVALEWAPRATLRERLARAVAVPAVAGGAVFLAALIVAIVLTATQSHSAATAEAEGAGSSRGEVVGGEAVGGEPDASPPNADAAAAGAPAGAATGGAVHVHVVGEVARPGVVELPPGARVAAAIEAAGGATEGAVLSAVNLARFVMDGEQLVVPDAAAPPPAASGGAAGGGGSATGPNAGPAPVGLNSADAAALEGLPRVGPALATAILEWREANGGFTSIEQLLEVPGIGPKTLDGLRDRVTL